VTFVSIKFLHATTDVNKYESLLSKELARYTTRFSAESYLQRHKITCNKSNKSTIPGIMAILMNAIMNHYCHNGNPAEEAVHLEQEVQGRSFLLLAF
jgi:hypothetical protein